MKALALLSLFVSLTSFAQTYENTVDFTISPAVVNEGTTHIAFEYLNPDDFGKRDLSAMDLPKMAATHEDNNKMIVAKMAFLSKKPIDTFTFEKMNTGAYISDMLNSVGISEKEGNLWTVTNIVKAYSIPMRVSFDLKFREVKGEALGSNLLNYIRTETSGFSGPGREKFFVLDMFNFSQLIYRNYSVVYIKEVGKKSFIFSGVVSAFNLSKANTYFNHPPFATTRGTMMKNIQTQTLGMISSIKN